MKTFVLFFILVASTLFLNAQTIVWTGASNTDWGTASNWNTNTVPTAGDSVVIPPTVNNPVIDTGRSVENILIQFDAVLDFGSKTLTINGDFINDGIIITTESTIVFSGNEAQNIYGNHTFHNIEIKNSNGVNNKWGELSIEGKLDLISGSFNRNNSVALLFDSQND